VERTEGRPGWAGRALLAFGLTLAFHAAVVAVAAGLLAVASHVWLGEHRVRPLLWLAGAVGAALALWLVLPRPGRSPAPPGAVLAPAQQPRLFAVIDRVARATGGAVPVEVYLAHTGAFVARAGSWMGVGGRSVLGLGLPLLQALEVNQLEAVLAHEMGHHLGEGRVARTLLALREAVGRKLDAIGEGPLVLRALRAPFAGYARLFLRLTRPLAHEHEHAADALAVRTVGARPLREALRGMLLAEMGFHFYWSDAVLPVLEAGFRPPLLAGFRHFLGAPARQIIERMVDQALAGQQGQPYDSHPTVRARLQALQGLPDRPPGAVVDTRRAFDLLDAVPALETTLLALIAPRPDIAAALVPLDWEDVGEALFPRVWAAVVERARPHLAGLTPGGLPADPAFYAAFARQVLGGVADGEAPPALAVRGASQIAAAVMLVLRRQGWTVRARPGEALLLEHDGLTWEPLPRLLEVARGAPVIAAWRAECERAGVAGVDLGSAGLTRA
jgi:Zn-dependent protease with chaperone function